MFPCFLRRARYDRQKQEKEKFNDLCTSLFPIPLIPLFLSQTFPFLVFPSLMNTIPVSLLMFFFFFFFFSLSCLALIRVSGLDEDADKTGCGSRHSINIWVTVDVIDAWAA